MNLLPCRLDSAAQSVVISGSATRSARKAFALATIPAGETLTLGVRPEHIRIETSARPDSIAGELYVRADASAASRW